MKLEKKLIIDENEILNYNYENFKPLLDLIPKIKATENFSSSELVTNFQKLAYESKIMIDFNWLDWQEGNVIAEKPDFDFSSLNVVSICKLITAVVQSESYVDEGLKDYFEEGIILDLLESLEQKVKV